MSKCKILRDKTIPGEKGFHHGSAALAKGWLVLVSPLLEETLHVGKPYFYQELVSSADLHMCILTHVLLNCPEVVLHSPHSPSGCHEKLRMGIGAQVRGVRVDLQHLTPVFLLVHDEDSPCDTIPKSVYQTSAFDSRQRCGAHHIHGRSSCHNAGG